MNHCQKLLAQANQLRVSTLRMISQAKSGHPGGSLSCMDILTALYFGGILRHDPKNPKDPDRDYFILSKGHASAALYAVLAERGYFPKQDLLTFRELGSHLQGHPTPHTPGVEVAAGSLGQGLSFSVGIALALKQDQKPNHIFTLLGDGELQEGQVWEAAMAAGHFQLDHLTVIVDRNGLQIDGKTEDVMQVGDVGAKFAAFGWEVQEIDGHNLTAILQALNTAKATRKKPFAIIANTVKGKGAPCAENNFAYHGVPLSAEELQEAEAHLQATC